MTAVSILLDVLNYSIHLHIQCDAIGGEIKRYIDERMELNPRLYYSLCGQDNIPYHGRRFPNSDKVSTHNIVLVQTGWEDVELRVHRVPSGRCALDQDILAGLQVGVGH
jgi:hypothetical protein